MKELSEELLVRYCSPTLAGLKLGSLFNCGFESLEFLKKQIIHFNRELNRRGVWIEILRTVDDVALIYVYRPQKLRDALADREVSEFLADNGYTSLDLRDCISHLKERLLEGDGFPHEIGVFLDYPLEDVKAFIKYKGANCKCIGCWKVYTNEYEAEKIFARYKKCTDIYCRLYGQGRTTIQRLTVPLDIVI